MTDERLITLVKLYNRLSFYFCLVKDDKPIPDISESTTIGELQEALNKIYDDFKDLEERETAARATLKGGIKFLRNNNSKESSKEELKEEIVAEVVESKEEPKVEEKPVVKKTTRKTVTKKAEDEKLVEKPKTTRSTKTKATSK